MALRTALIKFASLRNFIRPISYLKLKQQTNPVVNSSIFIRLAKFHLLNRPNKPLFTKSNLMMTIKKKLSLKDIAPHQPNLESPSMFSADVILKFYECIPIIFFTTVGFTCEMLWTMRLAVTRDDVRYAKKMGHEVFDLDAKPPQKKFRNYNCDYENWPQGLLDAKEYFKDWNDCEAKGGCEEVDDKKKKKKKK